MVCEGFFMKKNVTNTTIQRYALTDTYTISRILKGGWQLSANHSSTIYTEQAIEDMFAFVEAGIATFDFGDIYTGVEELIGEFRKKYFKRFGENPKLQLHTKFVPDLSVLSTLDKKYVEKIIDRSLTRLGVEQINLVQFHWWDYDVPRYIETMSYLSQQQKKGKIQYLGVTNFDVPHLQEIIDSGVSILTNQVQYSVIDHRPENGMSTFCQKNNIHLLCYGTVAGGFLSDRYLEVDEPMQPYENRSLTKYMLMIEEIGGWKKFQEILALLSNIAQKYDVSITTIATKYVLQKNQVAGIIVGARNSSHLEDLKKTFSVELTDDEMRHIAALTTDTVHLFGDIYSFERIKGGKHAGIMKYNLNKK